MMSDRPRWLQLRRDGEPSWQVAATAGGVSATAVAAGALALHQFGTPWQVFILAAAASHYLMWAAPIGALCALIARRWATSGVAATAVVLTVMVQAPTGAFPPYAGPIRPLVVLQANLGVGQADPDVLTALVRDNDVDLLATEELTPGEESALIVAGLDDLLPHRYTAPLPGGGAGLGLWSRFPLGVRHNVPGYSYGVLTAHVAHGGGLTFVAAHLSPPFGQPVQTWRREIADLRRLLADLPAAGPVVVAGDFNATVDHTQFRALLTGGYADAAQQTGAGYLPTYPDDRWWGPLIGIDHVLLRGAVAATGVTTHSIAGSDHRAVLAVLTFT
jgi:endonuclease/exonuclease/phosphatase (EEP) superfamily protein YafD